MLEKALKFLLAILCLSLTLTGCQKQNEWLEAKNSKALVVPETIDDYQAILDDFLNVSSHFPIVGIVGSDNLFLQGTAFSTLDLKTRNLYTWQSDIWADDRSVDWEYSYTLIEYANIVLDGLQKIDNKSSEKYKSVIGQAYFLRALAYYNLAQLFCKPYTVEGASSDLGLPLRNTSDVNVLFQRSTIKDTYDFIIKDATSALELLPNQTASIYRSSKIAANALLAKTHFVMGNYSQSLVFASAVLDVKKELLDFNTAPVDLSLTYRFPAAGRANPEIIFYGEGTGYSLVLPSTASPAMVDSNLIALYSENDLRLATFYIKDSGTKFYKYRGSYTGTSTSFCGLAVNEILLLKAECLARSGQGEAALSDLTYLLKYRYKTGTTPVIGDVDEALSMVLQQRRMELPFTSNIRWEDLRRLNLNAATSIQLSRDINGTKYDLPPNDLKYTLPIPDNEIQLSRILQNNR